MQLTPTRPAYKIKMASGLFIRWSLFSVKNKTFRTVPVEPRRLPADQRS